LRQIIWKISQGIRQGRQKPESNIHGKIFSRNKKKHTPKVVVKGYYCFQTSPARSAMEGGKPFKNRGPLLSREKDNIQDRGEEPGAQDSEVLERKKKPRRNWGGVRKRGLVFWRANMTLKKTKLGTEIATGGEKGVAREANGGKVPEKNMRGKRIQWLERGRTQRGRERGLRS